MRHTSGFARLLASTLLVTASLNADAADTAAINFDARLVENIPIGGPNCYFSALTANQLLKVPAMTLDDKIAELMFLNPAVCAQNVTPEPGAIGLEENMGIISHVFIYLGPNRRFEKAGPTDREAFQFKDASANTASRFVQCHEMQKWVDDSIASSPPSMQTLDLQLKEIEAILDVRSGPKSTEKFRQLKTLFDQFQTKRGEKFYALYHQLQNQLSLKGIMQTPFAGMLNSDYYNFAITHPELLRDREIFMTLWLSARLSMLENAFIYYQM